MIGNGFHISNPLHWNPHTAGKFWTAAMRGFAIIPMSGLLAEFLMTAFSR